MQNPIFRGVATALITPFTSDTMEIDYPTFGKIIDWQIEQGVDALIVAGTTGESSTLADQEHRDLITYAIDKVGGRVPVIAGVGSNDTAYAVCLSKFACQQGADALLVVTPYYNKATQKGLVQMFTAIADAVTCPVMLYNVPSRTGVNIAPSTYAILAEHSRIVATKEANGDISSIVHTSALTHGKLDIYSGNDDQVIPVLAMGGAGVVSVLSNIAPRLVGDMCRAWFAGDTQKAAEIQRTLQPLSDVLFCEVNPIPVKGAMAMLGHCENSLRLPLSPMEEGNMAKLKEEMVKVGLL